MNWTAEQDDILKSLWGQHKTKAIAHVLGVSKNAVCGRGGRLKLPKYERLVSVREKRVNKPKLVERRPPPKPVNPLNIPFFDLEPRHCRFPVEGEGYKTLFCGHTVAGENSYCGFHCSIVYEAPKARKPSWNFRRAA